MISIFIYLELAKYKLSSIFEFSFLVAALMFSYNIWKNVHRTCSNLFGMTFQIF